jgi:hypothetical protein
MLVLEIVSVIPILGSLDINAPSAARQTVQNCYFSSVDFQRFNHKVQI